MEILVILKASLFISQSFTSNSSFKRFLIVTLEWLSNLGGDRVPFLTARSLSR